MKIIFSDFDGTLTHNEELGAIFFDIINLVSAHQAELVLVSGRSVSWGHFLLTHFPLKHVIMEGGGVILHKNKEGMIEEEYLVSPVELEQIEKITNDLVVMFPEAILSKDSFGRRVDRALEYRHMDKETLDAVKKYLDNEGVTYSQSNVHLNFWFGEVSKFKACDYFLKNYYQNVQLDECIFYGDAMNDESMFQHMPNSVGVSNILNILDNLTYKPKVVLEGRDNIGPSGVFNHLKELFSSSAEF